MLRSWRVGSAFGIGVFLHPLTLLLPMFIYWDLNEYPNVALIAAIGAAFTMFCVLLHEFGHALMARQFNIGTEDITLYPIGGVARLRGMGNDPIQEIWIALAGPAVNVVIAILLTLVMRVTNMPIVLPDVMLLQSVPFGPAVLSLILWSNVMLVLFNLLPAFPMDGGRVFRAVMTLGFGRLTGTEIAAGVGAVMAGVFLLFAVLTSSPMLGLIGVLAFMLGRAELAAVRQAEKHRRLHAIGAHGDWQPEVDHVEYTVHPSAMPVDANFSGFTLDRQAGMWIEWQNGRPIAASPCGRG